MELSRRISSLSPSPTVALNAKAQAMAKQGINVVNFTVGEPDYPTPASVTEKAIAALKAGKTKYGAAGGGLPLREAIVNKMQRDNGLTFAANQVVVGIGAKEILFHLSLALLNEGDEVLIPAPYWVSYPDHCKAAGAVAVTLPMPKDLKASMLTVDMIEKAETKNTKAIILNSPNNPGGYIIPEKELRTIGQYLVQKNWWIITDEIYEYLSFDEPHVSILKLCPELADRTIVVNGLSKSFAMTGWRVGYACGPNKVIDLVKNLQSQSSTCLPAFIEEAAIFALNEGPDLMIKEIALMKKRRDLAVKELSAIPNVHFLKPQGAFYVFVDIREVLAKASRFKDAMAFCSYLLEEHHLAVVPGEAFGVPGFFRMSYSCDDTVLVEGIKRFSRAVSSIA